MKTCSLRLLLVALTGIIFAAEGRAQSVLFSDDFQKADPAWGTTPFVIIGGGKMTLTAEPSKGQNELNQSGIFQNCTITATFKITAGDDQSSIGIAFWAKDYNDFYTLECFSNGQFAVYRKAAERWLTPVAARDSADIKKGVGQSNELQVVIKDNEATLLINGKEQVRFKGQPPEGGGLVGFRVGAGKTKAVGEVSDFKVTK